MVKVVVVGFLKDLKDYLLLLHLQMKSNYLVINMFFSLKFIKDNDHFETIDVEMQNFDELLTVSSEKVCCTCEKSFIFLFTDGNLIDENNY